MWTEIFSVEPADRFQNEQCPMLIGIMRRSADEASWGVSSEYEFQTLLECDTLIRTQEKSTRETLLRELIVFKEKHDENEEDLVNFEKYFSSEIQFLFSHLISSAKRVFVWKSF